MKSFRLNSEQFENIISRLEDSSAPWWAFALTFLFIITLRNFLEVFSAEISIEFLSFLGFLVWYSVLASILALLLKFITGEQIKKVIRLIIPSFVMILLAPVIDLIISGGKYYHITYLLPSIHSNLIGRFFTFFGSFEGIGVTPGLKLEIALGLLGSFIYFRIKKTSYFRSLVGTFAVYVILFFFGSTPFLLKWILEKAGLRYTFSHSPLNQLHLILFLMAGTLLFYLMAKDLFRAVKDDIRGWRIIAFELLFGGGVILAMKGGYLQLSSDNLFGFILIPISIFLAILYCTMENNIADLEIDRISNSERPLIKNSVSLSRYRRSSWLFLGAALLTSGVVGFVPLFLILLFIGNYFLYSVPPLRLKRIPLLSKLSISVNSLALVILGFTLAGGELYKFPSLIATLILGIFTPTASFIDIKDYEGDKKAGVKTLPVLLGLKKSKIIIGIFLWLAYLSPYFIAPVLIIPGFFLGLIQFYLINKEPYREWPVFLVHLITLLGLGLWWLW